MRYRYEDEGYRGEERPFEGRQEVRHGRGGWDNPRSWEDRDEGSYWQSRGDSWEEDERRRGMIGRGGYAGSGGSYGRSRMQGGAQSYGQGMGRGIGQAGWHERGDYERGRMVGGGYGQSYGNNYGNAYGGGRDFDREGHEYPREGWMQDRDTARDYGMRGGGGVRDDWDRSRRDMGDWSQGREQTFSPRETGFDFSRERSHYYGPRGISAFGQMHTQPMHTQPMHVQPMRSASFDRGERAYASDDHEEGLGNRMMRGIRNMFGGGGGPKGYRRSDERIREDVCDRLVHLAQHGEVDSSDVEVQVKDGEVTLVGAVRERRWKHMLEDIADAVPGVRDVHNQLRVNRDDARSTESMEERRGTTGATANNPLGGAMQSTQTGTQTAPGISANNGNPAMRRS